MDNFFFGNKLIIWIRISNSLTELLGQDITRRKFPNTKNKKHGFLLYRVLFLQRIDEFYLWHPVGCPRNAKAVNIFCMASTFPSIHLACTRSLFDWYLTQYIVIASTDLTCWIVRSLFLVLPGKKWILELLPICGSLTAF